MTVTVVSLLSRGERGIEVCFEISDGEHIDKETFLVGIDTVATLNIKKGECDKELFDKVSEASRLYSAVRRGTNILGYGACSEKGLTRKLIAKGEDPAVVACAVKELVKRGYIDPHADAAREAEKCARKLWGKRRIVAELYKKGYSEDSVKNALYSLEDNEVDFVEICAERIRMTVKELPSDPMAKRKLTMGLQRYGFSLAEIKEAMRVAFKG